MLHRPHDNFSLKQELHVSQILILDLFCDSTQISNIQSILMERLP
jgi:hypothetical protein